MTLVKNITRYSVLGRLFTFATSNVARQALSEILVTLSFSQRENTNILIEFLMAKYSRVELSDLPLYLMCLQKIIRIEDQYAEIRAGTFLTHANMLLMKNISSSFFHYSYMTDLILNYAHENIYAQKYFSSGSDKFSHLLSWLKDNAYPIQRKINWLKSSSKQIEVTKPVSKAVRALSQIHSNKKIKLLNLLLSSSTKSSKDFLSIDFKEEEYHNFFQEDFTESAVLNKEFNIKINGEWKIGVVCSSCDTILNFSYDQSRFDKRQMWISIGSNKIQPLNTRINHETSQLYQLLKREAEIYY